MGSSLSLAAIGDNPPRWQGHSARDLHSHGLEARATPCSHGLEARATPCSYGLEARATPCSYGLEARATLNYRGTSGAKRPAASAQAAVSRGS